MKESDKELLQTALELLKTEVRNAGCIFGIAVDHNDVDNSKLMIIEREKYLRTGLADGISVSITELNKGLIPRRWGGC